MIYDHFIFNIFLKTLLFNILVDCIWNEFGDWNTCSLQCDGGTQSRSRTVKTRAQHNGRECTGDSKEERSCNTHPCPGIPTKKTFGD